MIEGQMGLTWERWKRIVEVVESSGYAGLFRSDHFTNPTGPDEESLELIVALTYVADHSERLHFGPLVSPMGYRDPVMLTRQIAALSDLSGGRAILGMGAGWQQREHEAYGYDLLDVGPRVDRLADGLEVATKLLRSDGPVTHDGPFYRLKDAELLPQPSHHVPIMVGVNGPKRTMPLAARYADIWNGGAAGPDAFADKVEHLYTLVESEGRARDDVKATMMTGVFFGADESSLAARLERLRRRPDLAELSIEDLIERVRTAGPVVGGPDEVREQLKAYEAAGVEEIMLQWFDLTDIDSIAAFAEVWR